jgi:hypothetical protein
MAFAADPDTEAPTLADSFSTVAWTGTGNARSITGLGFKPNLAWIKIRTQSYDHNLIDTIRGVNKQVRSNRDIAEVTNADLITSFDTDGVSLGTGSDVNKSGDSFVGWFWKADDNEATIFGGPAIAVYKFEDNANDVTGNYNGTASNVSYVTGKFNKAADFNGSSSFIDVSGVTLGDRSISLWVKFDDVTVSYQTIYDTDQRASAGHSFGDWTLNYYGVNDGAKLVQTWGKHDGSDYEYGTFDFTASNDTWYHIVTVDAPNNHALYINGEKKTYTTIRDAGENRALSSAELTFGQKENTGEALNGQLDQIRIYRGAISDVGVAELYAETVSDNDDLELGGPPEILVSANANAGFSIAKWTGDGVARKIPHGLSAVPEMIITKRLTGTSPWYTYNAYLNGGTNPAHYFVNLNTDAAETSNGSSGGSLFNSTPPTSTIFNIGTSLSGSGDDYIAYCFHSVSGYSKFGSYTGTAGALTVTTGFQPDFLMVKNITSAGYSWYILDSVRGGSGGYINKFLAAESSQAETEVTNGDIDVTFTSTGFQYASGMSSTDGFNKSGDTYIYMAIKMNPTPMPLAGNMSFLVIAGGGGGSSSAPGNVGGAGGGAGGLRTSYGSSSGGGSSSESDITLAAGTYTITVGAGGGGATSNADGSDGVDSSIAATGLTTITSIGGGGGAKYQNSGRSGGSGGGVYFGSSIGSGTANQGFNGGTTVWGSSSGGGGGAGAVGGTSDSRTNVLGSGGAGLSVSISGASVAYAGGGGTGKYKTEDGGPGLGGSGVGGAGASSSASAGGNGVVNTGSGGGGGFTGASTTTNGGDGSSGVVILRLLTSEYSGTTTGSPTVTTDGTHTIIKYTGSGTYVHS